MDDIGLAYLASIPLAWAYFAWQIYHDPESPEHRSPVGASLLGGMAGNGWWPLALLVWWKLGGPLKPLKPTGPR